MSARRSVQPPRTGGHDPYLLATLLYHLVMMWVWVTLAIAVGLTLAAVFYVSWRDRQRRPSAEDDATSRLAASEAARHDADRHVKKLDNHAGM